VHASFQKRAFRVHSNTHTNTHIEKNVRVNPILLFPLVIFPHFARRCEGRVAVHSSDAEKQNGGRHRSGALCFFLFFLGSQFFLHFAVVVVVVVVLVVVLLPREKTETRELSREPSRGTFIFLRERDSFAFDSVARRRLCSSRGWWWSSSVARGNFFSPSKNFIRDGEKFLRLSVLLSSGFCCEKNLSLLCLSKTKNKLTYALACFITTLSLSLFPSFLEFTEKEMGKTSVKPKRQTVASEDARENERQGHRHRRRG